MLLPLLTHLLQSWLTLVLLSDRHSPTINDKTRIFIFIQCHGAILNSNILIFTQYATDFILALELCINKIEGEVLILRVDGDCQFPLRCPLFLHLPKKKGASGSRRWLVSWFDYYIICIFTKQIRRREGNGIFFIGSRCHA